MKSRVLRSVQHNSSTRLSNISSTFSFLGTDGLVCWAGFIITGVPHCCNLEHNERGGKKITGGWGPVWPLRVYVSLWMGKEKNNIGERLLLPASRRTKSIPDRENISFRKKHLLRSRPLPGLLLPLLPRLPLRSRICRRWKA